MKACFKCEQAKPMSEFYRHSAMADGHLGKCKACCRADAAANRNANIERFREYDRKRGVLLKRKANVARNRDRLIAENPNYPTEESRRHRAANPEKYRARTAVNNAVRDGRLVRQPCEGCGSRKVHAHHEDYSKPLDVRWLCAFCHGLAHRRANQTHREVACQPSP